MNNVHTEIHLINPDEVLTDEHVITSELYRLTQQQKNE